MAFEKRNMTGALFANKHRSADNHPVMKGYVVVNGVEFELAGWSKQTRAGDKMLSLKVSEAHEQETERPSVDPQAPPDEPPRGGGDLDDEIPFGPEVR